MKFPDNIKSEMRGWAVVLLLAFVALTSAQCSGYLYKIASGFLASLRPPLEASTLVPVTYEGADVPVTLKATQGETETQEEMLARFLRASSTLRKCE